MMACEMGWDGTGSRGSTGWWIYEDITSSFRKKDNNEKRDHLQHTFMSKEQQWIRAKVCICLLFTAFKTLNTPRYLFESSRNSVHGLMHASQPPF